MNWKERFTWKKLELTEIKVGMTAKVIVSNDKIWSTGAWIKDMQGKELKVTEIHDRHDFKIQVDIPRNYMCEEFLNAKDRYETGDTQVFHCFGAVDWFEYRN